MIGRNPERNTEGVVGQLEMLVLKTLALAPLHGFGIAQRIEQMSRGVFEINPGSLFPALRRLERAGCITGQWRPSENNRRARWYTITETGRRELQEERRAWLRKVGAIARILEA